VLCSVLGCAGHAALYVVWLEWGSWIQTGYAILVWWVGVWLGQEIIPPSPPHIFLLETDGTRFLHDWASDERPRHDSAGILIMVALRLFFI